MGTSSAWAEGVRRVSKEAAGVVTLQVVQPGDVPEMLTLALLGDREAARLASLVAQVLRRVETAPRRRQMLCGSCPRTLRRGGFSVVCAIPHREDAREALTLAICQRCATDHDDVVARAGAALRRVWPDLRAISLHPGEGRA